METGLGSLYQGGIGLGYLGTNILLKMAFLKCNKIP
jgi:hypothetical protein